MNLPSYQDGWLRVEVVAKFIIGSLLGVFLSETLSEPTPDVVPSLGQILTLLSLVYKVLSCIDSEVSDVSSLESLADRADADELRELLLKFLHELFDIRVHQGCKDSLVFVARPGE